MKLPISLLVLGKLPHQHLHQYQQIFTEIIQKSIPKINDFAQERNLLIQQSTQPWILFLDSDEKLTPQLILKLKKIFSSSKQLKINAFAIKRVDFFHGHLMRFGELGSVYKIRLAKKDQITFVGKVHETARVTGSVKKISQPIWHYPHQSVAQFLKKISYYSQLKAQELSRKKRIEIWQILIYPPGKFIINFIFKLGFLDGFPGLIYASMMSIHSLAVRVFLYEITHSKNHD